MSAYYNEFEPRTAAWLRELIKRGLIADGVVDERNITEVEAGDLTGFSQCHFFAGIGGWSYALRLAGISDEFACWTGSCPCQPFSDAGNRSGTADERHLWPEFFRLIAECKPCIVLGEQVEGAVKHGWLDNLQADMEGEGYAVGAAVLGAHSVGAHHKRQRLYWGTAREASGRVANNGGQGRKKQSRIRKIPHQANGGIQGKDSSRSSGVEFSTSQQVGIPRQPWQRRKATDRVFWGNPDWIECRDGKLRPIEPGLEPVADGIPARVVRLRGYGNAIVPQTAALFINAFMASTDSP